MGVDLVCFVQRNAVALRHDASACRRHRCVGYASVAAAANGQVDVVVARVGVAVVLKALHIVAIAPAVGTVGIEQNIVGGIHRAVAVNVVYLNGYLGQIVGAPVAVDTAQLTAAPAVEAYGVGGTARQGFDVARAYAVDARAADGNLPPFAACQPRVRGILAVGSRYGCGQQYDCQYIDL